MSVLPFLFRFLINPEVSFFVVRVLLQRLVVVVSLGVHNAKVAASGIEYDLPIGGTSEDGFSSGFVGARATHT